MMVDCNLKRSRTTCCFFSKKLVELGWLYKPATIEKFSMCSFCGSMKRVTIVAYGNLFSG